VPLDEQALRAGSAVAERVYANTKLLLQRLLGIRHRASPAELCTQFGCVRLERGVKAALAALRSRFAARLPPQEQAFLDLSRPVFLAAAFYIVARKHKVSIDRVKLQKQLAVTPKEFAEVHAAAVELCPEFACAAAAAAGAKRKAVAAEEGGAEHAMEDEEEKAKVRTGGGVAAHGLHSLWRALPLRTAFACGCVR
jgi:origin recognition complex subunit 6